MHHFFRSAAACSSSSGLSRGRQSVGNDLPNCVSSAISRADFKAFVPTLAASLNIRASSSARFVFSLSMPCCCLLKSSASSTNARCCGSGAGSGSATSSSSATGRFLCLRRRSSFNARLSLSDTNSSPSLSLSPSIGSPLMVQQFWKASQTFSSSARGRFVAIAATASCACRVWDCCFVSRPAASQPRCCV